MRVDPFYVHNLSSALSQTSAVEANLTNELSSGLRVSQLGDDPIAATQSLQLTAQIGRSDTFVQTASRQSGLLQVTDSTLGEVVSQLTSAVSLATKASNGTLNDANRQALIVALQGVQTQVLSLANTSYLGQHLFSGSQGSVQPFSLDGNGNATYAGDQVQQNVITPSGQSLVTSLAGSSVFQAAGADVFAALGKAISDLSSNSAGIEAAAGNLTAALDNVTTQRSIVGTSLSRLQATSTYTQTQEANLKVEQGTLVAADYVSVATQLQSSEVQHQALLNVVATLGKGSLFDYIK